MFRSVRTRRLAPSAMCMSAWTKRDFRAASRAAPPPPAGKWMPISRVTTSGWDALRRRTMSSGVRIGWGIFSIR
jgi:hypothetical protein